MTIYSIAGQGNVFEAAVSWLGGLLQGQIAVMLAVIGVAMIGYAMLSGQIPVRAAIRTIVGCFVLFGAAAIARGLVGIVGASATAAPAYVSPSADLAVPSPEDRYAPPRTSANPFDPYASTSEYDRRGTERRNR